ncbi:PREDICTED: probable 2-oxoglutarate-dependent dioxygenase AOP1 [Tarenaya hassleriana]|uniref:probable 2-oxoglutarate-dependent dioxygenase AOP1 n=1 Tax=Tarenaya hassleriana TaxID=28532 RepID=UPI00053CA63C|nr:PREDICTED: probable 2-oxoglutarate-dependent dioxygenase AOP1 [Tarenaya hassleriana]
MGSISTTKIPVLDFTNQDLIPDTPLWVSTSVEACKALEEYGCFVAVYGGAPPHLAGAAFSAAEELFCLPTETKRKNVNDKPYHGYVGQMSVIPLHEGLGIDYVTDRDHVRKFTELMWPQGNDPFCETVYSFSNAIAELDRLVVRMIFENYRVGKYYESHIGSKTYLLKFLKYSPPPEANPTPAFPMHTDKTFLSILRQNDVNGLEVKSKDGEWIALELPPNSYVVMAGDVSMGWSNDRIRSCEHRVTMSGNKKRYTLGLFSFVTGTISVPEELVDEKDYPLKYKPFDNISLIEFYATDEGRKAENTLKAYCGVW